MPLTVPLQGALRLLLQAHEFAWELNRDAWDFAVELASLRAAGLTNNDLRWLLYQNYVVQAAEVTGPLDEIRSFRPRGKLALIEESCFILTAAGIDFVKSSKAGTLPASRPACSPDFPATVPPADVTPIWDPRRRVLLYSSLVVKHFKVPAPNQEIVLATFEEEHWPPRIDDPLPPHAAIDPKQRLHDTVNSLNRNQRNSLLHFIGDGSGEGVCWEPTACAASRHGAETLPAMR